MKKASDSTSARFWRGGVIGLLSISTVFVLMTAYARVSPPTPSLGSFLTVLKLTVQAALFGLAVLLAVRALQRLPSSYLWVLGGAAVVFFYFFGRFPAWGVFWTMLFAIVPATLLGGSVSLIRGSSSTSWMPRLAAVAGLFALGYALAFFFRSGFVVEPQPNAAELTNADVVHISLPSPATPGSYTVGTLHFGSGGDLHRPEFAEAVDLKTDPVDGSPFIEGWEKRSGWARTRYWGFDATQLPVQGRVWYPDGSGPFPLVLIVHGNHAMEDFSDTGYAYLGELLASRGVITVSVDENFINSSFSGGLDELRGRGLRTENDARGWLLLEHLRQWRQWNATQSPGNPFYGKVDMERIGLIGHSRGGEAVAVAASFNRLSHYPDDASVAFDYGFGIRGIVAIAPVDGQYKPSGRGTVIDDTNYFVLHGSHDGDVQSFAGSRQFERVDVSGNEHRFRFKSSLYIYGANHGQFNTTWGRTDSSFPAKNFLNLTNIMPADEQMEIGKVYISAFFEICLNERKGYLPLFADARRGREWLPRTIYLTKYEDSRHRTIANFDEDFDVTTTTVEGGSIRAEHVTKWREGLVELKNGDKATSAVTIEWSRAEAEEPGRLLIGLPPSFEAGLDDQLVLSLAAVKPTAKGESPETDGNANANPHSPSKEDSSAEPGRTEPIDFTIELVDGSGELARLPLSHISLLQPPIEVQVRKSDLLNRSKTTEPVFQTYFFPLRDFTPDTESFARDEVREIRFRFDRTDTGALLIDDIGFTANRFPE